MLLAISSLHGEIIFGCDILDRQMNAKRLDDLIQNLLSGLPYFSRLGTCIGIRLSDYASQLCGCRSSRQIDDGQVEEVSEQFELLMEDLIPHIQECLLYIKSTHNYRPFILEMSEQDIEVLLETALYEMVIFDCHLIFAEYFLE
jgi:hypothetical protein